MEMVEAVVAAATVVAVVVLVAADVVIVELVGARSEVETDLMGDPKNGQTTTDVDLSR